MISTIEFLQPPHGYIRIPVWGHIPLPYAVKNMINHPHFFRLRGIKQLSFVELVFPGATHTRLEHCIGVFNLTSKILEAIINRPEFADETKKQLTEENIRTILAAGLLHDLGHYPHAHLLENLNISKSFPGSFTHHQELATYFLFDETQGESLASILEDQWKINPHRVIDFISGNYEKEPLARLISGVLDPDKMDYLLRDAHHCAVPYGHIDIGRLIESFIFDHEKVRLGMTEKGIPAFESLIFSKYMMTRHIYWQHTVKSFGVMMKRLVQDILDDGLIPPDELFKLFYESSDEQLLFRLDMKLIDKNSTPSSLLSMLTKRKPYKQLVSIGMTRTPSTSSEWVSIPSNIMSQKGKRSGTDIQTDNKQIMAIHSLYQDAGYRKQIEIKMVNYINTKYPTAKLESHHILIDSPGFYSIFEYEDLMSLRIFKSKSQSFTPYHKNQKTLFQPDFISTFEPYAKEFQIVVHPDKFADIQLSADEVWQLI